MGGGVLEIMLDIYLQGFAAGLMLCISFLDLAHNALNTIGFLHGNLWVSLKFAQIDTFWLPVGGLYLNG